ncbi:MAG: winged helix-turn-helix domain-containing protein [Candidatus Hodarchaeota archaeon]
MEKNLEKDYFEPTKEELIKYYDWGRLFQNETRVKILMYLRMNERLSFSQLRRLIGKSRSTIHHHLQKMIQGGIVLEVDEHKSRRQFTPKFYELSKQFLPAFSFHNINKLPLEKQADAFLINVKLHRTALFYLSQILEIFTSYLNSIEEIISIGNKSDVHELNKIWEGTSNIESLASHPVKFKDIFYFSTQVNEAVYRKYKKEMDELHDRIVKYMEEDEKHGGSKKKPYFIHHISAPLGKPYLIESEEQV